MVGQPVELGPFLQLPPPTVSSGRNHGEEIIRELQDRQLRTPLVHVGQFETDCVNLRSAMQSYWDQSAIKQHTEAIDIEYVTTGIRLLQS